MKNRKVYLDIHATELFLSVLGLSIGIAGAYVFNQEMYTEGITLVTVGILANLVAIMGVREKTRCSQ